MARYIKKPIEVEAFQLNSRGLVAEDWFWDAVSKNDIVTHFFGKNESCDAWCQIKTLEGVMSAFTGDYIIRGINGEIYPCKADIFEKTYSKVGTADVAEVKHGEWIVNESLLAADKLGLSIPLRWYKCSLCGRTEFEREPYCNCGAKMDGRSDGNE